MRDSQSMSRASESEMRQDESFLSERKDSSCAVRTFESIAEHRAVQPRKASIQETRRQLRGSNDKKKNLQTRQQHENILTENEG